MISLLLLFVFATSVQSQCIEKEYGETKYYFCKTPLSRSDAFNQCDRLNSSLIRIENFNENTWIIKNKFELQMYGDSWIGLKFDVQKNKWEWDDKLEGIINWINSIIGNKNDCIKTFGLSNFVYGGDCKSKLSFICKKYKIVDTEIKIEENKNTTYATKENTTSTTGTTTSTTGTTTSTTGTTTPTTGTTTSTTGTTTPTTGTTTPTTGTTTPTTGTTPTLTTDEKTKFQTTISENYVTILPQEPTKSISRLTTENSITTQNTSDFIISESNTEQKTSNTQKSNNSQNSNLIPIIGGISGFLVITVFIVIIAIKKRNKNNIIIIEEPSFSNPTYDKKIDNINEYMEPTINSTYENTNKYTEPTLINTYHNIDDNDDNITYHNLQNNECIYNYGNINETNYDIGNINQSEYDIGNIKEPVYDIARQKDHIYDFGNINPEYLYIK